MAESAGNRVRVAKYPGAADEKGHCRPPATQSAQVGVTQLAVVCEDKWTGNLGKHSIRAKCVSYLGH